MNNQSLVICKPDPNCKDCWYYRGHIDKNGYGVMTCQYWAIEPGIRGCQPGKDCIRYTKKKPTKQELITASAKPRKSSWDRERGYKLFVQGKFAWEIAQECCCSKASVYAEFASWRKKAEADGIDIDKVRVKNARKWNFEEGYRLYCEGWTSNELARHFEVGPITIERAFAKWKPRAAAAGIDHRLAYARRRRAKLKNGNAKY